MSMYARLTRGADHAAAFLIRPGGTIHTYGEVLQRARRMATVLTDHGAGPDTRVMVQIEKSVDAVALYLACLQIGAVYVPLNSTYTPREVEFFASDAEPTVFVGTPNRESQLAGVLPAPTRLLTLGISGEGTLTGSPAAADPLASETPARGSQIASMLYTSGTTGRSKGAMLTSDNLLANAEALYESWGWQVDDVLLHVLPIFHTHGLFVALNLAMMGGSQVHFHERFDVEAVLRDLPGSSVMMGVPTYYHRLLSSPGLEQTDLTGMRLFTSGSAPLSALVHAEFERRTGQRILERYGMTETGMLFSNPLDGERVAGTVGFALPGVEGRVVDDADRLCDPGVAGNVQVQGSGVFAGYWRLPDKTSQEFTDDGFFRTGDIGHMDEHGRLTLAGRSSDMIISGGLNVYPKEVETVLDSHPMVVESAVVGIPHPDFGEAVVGVIVAGDEVDLDELAATTIDSLASFKRPKHYEVVASLPRNAMGKIQKAELRTRFAGVFSARD